MRPIPQVIVEHISRASDIPITGCELRKLYTRGMCHGLARTLYVNHPDLFDCWVLCNQPREGYEEWQDWLSQGSAPATPNFPLPGGHAFVKVKGTSSVLDIEGLRSLREMKAMWKWRRLTWDFQVPVSDFEQWNEGDNSLDDLAAQAVFGYYEEAIKASRQGVLL